MNFQIDFADLFAHLPTPYMMLDCELRFIDANASYLATTGRNRAELLGQFVFDAFPETPERRTLFEDAFRRAIAGEANAVVRERFDIARPESEGGGFKRSIWTTHHIPVRDADGAIVGMLQKALDVTSEVEAEESRDAVLREFDHRIKNLLAKVGAISELTAREETDLATFLDKFRQRLVALSRTQSLLLQAKQEAAIADLLRAELSPYGAAGDAVELSGPDVSLAGSTAQTMGMAFHELATNAAKYGALGVPEGRVAITWSLITQDLARIEWVESGGPPVPQVRKRGFGTELIEKIVAHELQNPVDLRFEPAGVRCALILPVRHPGAFALRAIK